jgi:hypothetical protein
VIGLRDTRAVPSLSGRAEDTSPRGAMAALHEAIIEALAGLARTPDSTAALRGALDRGDWWAPRRTAVLRKAAASRAQTHRLARNAGSARRRDAQQQPRRARAPAWRLAAKERRDDRSRPRRPRRRDRPPPARRRCAGRSSMRRTSAGARSVRRARRDAVAHARQQRRRSPSASSATISVVGDYPIPRAAETMGD